MSLNLMTIYSIEEEKNDGGNNSGNVQSNQQ